MKTDIAKLQTKWKPRKKTGKTQFNRGKASGESWIARRQAEWGDTYVCVEKWVD